jgi:hypothetical protein
MLTLPPVRRVRAWTIATGQPALTGCNKVLPRIGFYTFATPAFSRMGAAVLNPQGPRARGHLLATFGVPGRTPER